MKNIEYKNSSEGEDLLHLVTNIALEKKARDPVILDLRSLSAFTEYFIIVTALNTRNVYAIVEEIKNYLKKNMDLQPLSIDGLQECTWALIDYGYFFVHIFDEQTRNHYEIEKLWSKARVIEYNEKAALEIRQKTEKINLDNVSEINEKLSTD